MNILFLFADQMHRDALRCMGNADVHTPNLDRLASEGVLFRNAYSNCPICTPFRINLFTGLYTSQTDTFANAVPIPDACHTLADALNDGGVRTGYVGKWHIGGKGNGPIPEELRGGFTEFVGYQCYNGFYEDVCFYDENGEARCYDRHRTDVTTDLALSRLEGMVDAPFALFVSYQAPHYPVQPAERYAEMYRDVRIHRRPNCDEIDPYTRTWSPPSPWPPGECPDYQRYGNDLDAYLRLYYAMVTQIDANVGRLLDKLEALGLAENTVIVFTADHGDMQGSHGLRNKRLPFEESAGIPLIVRVPGGARGLVTEALVSGIDFYPTCLDYAGLPPVAGLPGNNFAPLTQGDAQILNGPIFSEMDDWRMVRESRWKLVTEGEAYEPTHLYNLGSDPFELENLVDDPTQADRIRALRAQIIAWQQMTAATAVG
jgi:arylsulfatase A-like enzyme